MDSCHCLKVQPARKRFPVTVALTDTSDVHEQPVFTLVRPQLGLVVVFFWRGHLNFAVHLLSLRSCDSVVLLDLWMAV